MCIHAWKQQDKTRWWTVPFPLYGYLFSWPNSRQLLKSCTYSSHFQSLINIFTQEHCVSLYKVLSTFENILKKSTCLSKLVSSQILNFTFSKENVSVCFKKCPSGTFPILSEWQYEGSTIGLSGPFLYFSFPSACTGSPRIGP